MADDCTASFYNPAALVLAEHDSITIGYVYGIPKVDFDEGGGEGSALVGLLQPADRRLDERPSQVVLHR